MNTSGHHVPRVLLVGIDPVTRAGAQGITVANLFSEWNPDALGQLVLSGAAQDAAICAHTLQLPAANLPLEPLQRSKFAGTIRAASLLEDRIGAVGVTARAHRGLRVRLHLAARALCDLAPLRLPAAAARWIQEFRPAVIYSCLGNARLIALAQAASRAAGGVPIVPHFMDDWPSTLYADGTLWGGPHRVAARRLRRLLTCAPFGLTIGDAMAEEYRHGYEKEFHSFMNCVDDEEFVQSATKSKSSNLSALVWTYAGGLHLNRFGLLAPLANCIAAQGGTLRVHAPREDLVRHASALAALPGTETGTLATHQVMSALRASDVLVHIESFLPDEAAFTRLSVSTKLPQYFASGRPVLGVGPPGLASLRLIEHAGAGLTVTSETGSELVAGVARLSQEAGLREQYGRRGLDYARAHFMRTSVCARFHALLALASATGLQPDACGSAA